MASTFTIKLDNLRFYAEHGLYAEEAQVGVAFELNVSLTIKAPKTKVTSLEQTINYTEVYRIVNEIFSVRKALLETLAMEIAEELKQQFPEIRKASVEIIKLHPPITSFAGSVSVTYRKSFKD
jgi:7,8-dihydroneopterin aldolase/epimerase/oxygenase